MMTRTSDLFVVAAPPPPSPHHAIYSHAQQQQRINIIRIEVFGQARNLCGALYIHFKIGDARAVTIFFFGWRDAALHTPCRIHWIYVCVWQEYVISSITYAMASASYAAGNCARILNYWYERAAAPKRSRVRFQRARVLLVADYIYTYLYVVSGP